MSANTSRGYTYPQSTDNLNLWEWFQGLATDINDDITALLTPTVTNDPGAVQAGFTVNTAYGLRLFNSKIIHVALDLNVSSALTQTSGNVTDKSCYVLDSGWRPDSSSPPLTAAYGTGSTYGTVQLATDGNIIVQTASQDIPTGQFMRFWFTYAKA